MNDQIKTEQQNEAHISPSELNDGAHKHDLSEYDSTQWWYEELGKIFCLPISEHVTADMKRAANIARNLMLAVEEKRKKVPNERINGMPTDTELLNFLESSGKLTKYKWICRQSVTGRGWRLHQDPKGGKHITVRGAIEAAMKEYIK